MPRDFIERTSIIGTRERVVQRIRDYAASGVGTLSISPYAGDVDSGIATLRTVAEAFDAAGVAS